MMKQKKLGRSDLSISALGFGCSHLSGGYGKRDDAKSIGAIQAAVDRGITYFDTSDAYGNGHNEELLCSALKEAQNKVVIGTKFGNLRGDDGSYSGVNGRPEVVPGACEASLKRLGLDVIDLYYLHRVDPDTPIEDTVGAMSRLVEQGKVRYIGLCEADADTVRRAHGVHPITALQTEYSLWTRDVESATLPTCRELGIGFIGYAPLGRGFLAGAIKSEADIKENDRRPNFPRFSSENLDRNVALLEPLEALAREKNIHSAQLALAWVLAQGDDVTPIPGTMKIEHLQSNIAAVDVVLSDQDRAQLEKIFEPGVAVGNRYPDHRMHLVAG
jgi:aryl-alcohol dehydrogenase-like predicted oxidoreductase